MKRIQAALVFLLLGLLDALVYRQSREIFERNVWDLEVFFGFSHNPLLLSPRGVSEFKAIWKCNSDLVLFEQDFEADTSRITVIDPRHHTVHAVDVPAVDNVISAMSYDNKIGLVRVLSQY